MEGPGVLLSFVDIRKGEWAERGEHLETGRFGDGLDGWMGWCSLYLSKVVGLVQCLFRVTGLMSQVSLIKLTVRLSSHFLIVRLESGPNEVLRTAPCRTS